MIEKDYSIILNYIQHFMFKNKTLSSKVKSLIGFLIRLFVPRKLYLRGALKGRNIFIDLDGRKDHFHRVEKYVDELNLSHFQSKKPTQTSDFKVYSGAYFFPMLNVIKNFREIYCFCKVNNLSCLNALQAFVIYYSYYSVSQVVSCSVRPKNCLSLNFETSIGFSSGLKSENVNLNVISIQHGFMYKVNNENNMLGLDLHSDYYVFWSKEYKRLAESRLDPKCKTIIDGDFSNDNHKSYDFHNSERILFLSSFSAYSPSEVIEEEVITINSLVDIFKENLTVRLHPSINKKCFNKDWGILGGTIEFCHEITLAESVQCSQTVLTICSTAITEAFLMDIPVIILPSRIENILNLNFNTPSLASLGECDCNLISEKYGQFVDSMEVFYGKKTGALSKFISEEIDI
ncbi:hypothetical protein [uncultured Psychromonas sp.]|uniref:hypothetical protein n=1 Tax=uncultured Psychromonas sp. TaxID=173974 RepID=UPI00263643C2|nr:hypothetical protein [uncultured Psychromonas sp.]